MLVQAGHSVYEASGGADALAVLEQHSGTIDVLIADVVMPSMNGVDLALAILQKHPGIQIIFMSGYGEEVMYRYPQAPKAVVLGKPFSLPELARRVATLLSQDAGTTQPLVDWDAIRSPSAAGASCDMESDLPVRYFLAELDDRSRDDYEEHFFGCAICAQQVREFFDLADALRAALSRVRNDAS
jgi:CheY-like chemotaxis protein